MGKPVLIVVSGAPGTGKTTIAKILASDLRIPYLGKDLIKETLFDSMGAGDRAWSAKLGVASIELLFRLIDVQLQAGQSVVAESNFRRELDGPRFCRLQQKYSFGAVEVHCETERKSLLSRYERRAGTAGRHPGHYDTLMLPQIAEELDSGVYAPLAIGKEVIEVDTTDFEKVDSAALISAVRKAAEL